MLKIVIEDNNILFRAGMELYLRDFFVSHKQMQVEFYDFTEESVSQADIIIKSFVAGEIAFCQPTLNYRKKNSFILGVHTDANSLKQSILPLCIKDIAYINRSDSLCKIGDILFKGINRIKQDVPSRNCCNCKCVKLTHKQSDLISMIVAGASTHRIAIKLEISEKTVYAHKANLMTRLGIRSECQLVRLLNTLNKQYY